MPDHSLEEALEAAKRDPDQMTVEQCIAVAESGADRPDPHDRPKPTPRPLSIRQIVARRMEDR